MTTTKTVQMQRPMQTVTRMQPQVQVATARFAVPSPATVSAVRFAPRQAESIHSPRDGHWAVYVFVAVICLAGTIFASSGTAQGILDRLIQ